MPSLLSFGTKILHRMIVPGIAKINLVLTFNCNHKCVTCNIWKTHGYNLTKNSLWKDKGELTVDEVEKIVTRNKFIYLSLTGGETFLRKDIKEIIEVCLQHVPMVTITSNGSMPEKMERVVRQVLPGAKGLLDINISLDGNKEQHDAFTQVEGSYEKATDAIRRLAAMRSKDFRLSIETLVSAHANNGRKAVRQLARELNIPVTYSIEQKAPFYDNEDNVINPGKLPELKLSSSLLDIFSCLYIKGAMNGHTPQCVAGQYTCSVTPYGDVMPCLFLPVILKNLRETNYVLGKLDYKGVVGKCTQKCWTPCEAYPTIMFRPWRLL